MDVENTRHKVGRLRGEAESELAHLRSRKIQLLEATTKLEIRMEWLINFLAKK